MLPKQLLQKASAAQLAVFRGEASSAPVGAATPRAAASVAVAASESGTAPAASGIVPTGLTLNLSLSSEGRLKGQAANATDKDVAFTVPGRTLFSNGTGDVVTLWDVPVKALAKASVEVTLPVALTSSAHPTLAGNFHVRAGSVEELKPLLNVFAQERPHSAGAMQTAVLSVTEDVPLDIVAGFPRLRPAALTNADKPFQVSTVDILEALSLLNYGGTGVLYAVE